MRSWWAGAAAVLMVSMSAGCSLGATPEPADMSVPPVPSPSAAPSSASVVAPDRPLIASLPDVELRGMKPAPAGEKLSGYLGQEIEWSSCGEYECATVLAPYDWATPQERAVTLFIKRRKGDGSLGALFVNPGGPGYGGTSMVEQERWDAMPGYDIVGWDPRGTGRSTPVVCFDSQDGPLPQVDRLVDTDMSPDDEAEYKKLVAANTAFGASCAKHSGRWLTLIGTDQTVQDMDLLRQLLGQEKFNFVGYSYGTWLGAQYAHKYPTRVGRMILDSAVNVTDDDSLSQAQGFDRAFALFAEWSATNGRKLGRTAAEVTETVKKFLDGLDAAPMKVGTRTLSQARAVGGTVVFLYGEEDSWKRLQQVLEAAILNDDAEPLLRASDMLVDRDDKGIYATSYFAFPSIMCRDAKDRGLEWARQYWQSEKKAAPMFGHLFGPSAMCEVWPVAPLELDDVSAPDAAPILVVGTTGDPATPYEFARWMADELGSGVLVTLKGRGHGSFGGYSACLNDIGHAYLNKGTVPTDGTVCT